MDSFTFYNPVKLHFGEDALEKLPKELEQYGSKVLVVYGGGSIKSNGVYNAVIEKLQQADKTVFELSGVEPNPRVETARIGIDICKKKALILCLLLVVARSLTVLN